MEHVLAVPRSHFERLGVFSGFEPEVDRYLPVLLDPQNQVFLERASAELDSSHKQLIPYCVFIHEGKWLCYRRGGGSGEKRLAAKHSVGIGGHINPIDEEKALPGEGVYQAALARELLEELGLSNPPPNRIVGLINDDSNEVGQVHLGVVHVFEMSHGDLQAAEEQLESMSWMAPEELDRLDTLESWSRMVLEARFQWMAN